MRIRKSDIKMGVPAYSFPQWDEGDPAGTPHNLLELTLDGRDLMLVCIRPSGERGIARTTQVDTLGDMFWERNMLFDNIEDAKAIAAKHCLLASKKLLDKSKLIQLEASSLVIAAQQWLT